MANRKSFINVRGGFSDTSGVAPCNTQMQLHEFDKRTRTLLSNELFKLLKALFEDAFQIFRIENADGEFCEDILSDVFIEPVRLLNNHNFNWIKVFQARFDLVFTEGQYNEVLDLLWYIGKWIYSHAKDPQIKNLFYNYE